MAGTVPSLRTRLDLMRFEHNTNVSIRGVGTHYGSWSHYAKWSRPKRWKHIESCLTRSFPILFDSPKALETEITNKGCISFVVDDALQIAFARAGPAIGVPRDPLGCREGQLACHHAAAPPAGEAWLRDRGTFHVGQSEWLYAAALLQVGSDHGAEPGVP